MQFRKAWEILLRLCKSCKERRPQASAAAGGHRKVLRVMKADGKAIELTAPISVKELLIKFPGFGIGVSNKVSAFLPPDYLLNLGSAYYLVPELKRPVPAASDAIQGEAVKRIRVRITKQQLQQLLLKQISLQEAAAGPAKATTMADLYHPRKCWKPKLEAIAEGNE